MGILTTGFFWATCVMAVAMLLGVGVLFVQVKWFNEPTVKSQDSICRTLLYAKDSAAIMCMLGLITLILYIGGLP